MRASLADPVFADWLTSQRWFGGKGRNITRISESASAVLLTGDPELRLVLARVDYDLGDAEDYQLLLGLTEQEVEQRLEYAVLARVDGQVVYDAVHDPVLCRCAAAAPRQRRSRSTASPSSTTRSSTTTLPGRVMTAEQSNTSIVYGDELILKLFRRLQPGANPDIEVTKALADAGCPHVAATAGLVRRPVARRDHHARPAAALPARAPRAGRWRPPPCATCSPRRTCTPTRSVVTSPRRPSGSASPPARCTCSWRSVLPSATAGAERVAGHRQSSCSTGSTRPLAVVPELAPFADALRDAYELVLAGAPSRCRCSGCTATTTSGRSCARRRAGCCSTSRASRPGRCRSGAR